MTFLWPLIALVLLGGGIFYVSRRLITPFQLPKVGRIAARITLALVMILPIVAMVLIRRGGAWTIPLAWVAFIALGFLSLTVTLLVVRDVLALGFGLMKRLPVRVRPAADPPADPARRRFLIQAANLGVMGAAGALTGYGVYEARKRPDVVRMTLPVRNLPAAFDGFRIVQITDVHAGLTIHRDWIESVVDEAKGLQADLIAFTGDMVDGSVAQLRNDVEPLGQLDAPHGKFFVTGNHEYYSGVEQWVEEARRLGYAVLLNEHVLIERGDDAFVLAGVTDYTGGQFLPSHRSDPAKALEGAPGNMPRILLAHQPRTLEQTADLGVDVMLTGHTHGEQFIPWNLLATLGQPYIRGLHNHRGTWIYVSKGTGYWGPPVRVGARSEITVVTLATEIAKIA